MQSLHCQNRVSTTVATVGAICTARMMTPQLLTRQTMRCGCNGCFCPDTSGKYPPLHFLAHSLLCVQIVLAGCHPTCLNPGSGFSPSSLTPGSGLSPRPLPSAFIPSALTPKPRSKPVLPPSCCCCEPPAPSDCLLADISHGGMGLAAGACGRGHATPKSAAYNQNVCRYFSRNHAAPMFASIRQR